MNQLLLFALFTHFLILQLSNPLSPPDIRVTQPYVLLSSRCGVTQLTGLSLHTSSTPPLPRCWTLLWVVLHHCPSCPPVHWADLSWLISVSLTPSRPNISSENSLLSVCISLCISILSNKCVHRTPLRCAGLGIFLSSVQSIFHKPLDCEDRKSFESVPMESPNTDMSQ